MTTAAKALSIARLQLGYVEGRGNRTKYGAWYGLNGQPWCAMFTSWVLQAAGLPRGALTHFAYTPAGYRSYERAGRWHRAPQVGDLVFFAFSAPSSARPHGISHIGIVEAVEAGAVITIEGNTDEAGGRTGGKVMRKRRTARIIGYGRPPYTDARPDPKPEPVPVMEEDMWTIVNQRNTPHLWALGGTVRPVPGENHLRQMIAAGVVRNRPDAAGKWPPMDLEVIQSLQ